MTHTEFIERLEEIHFLIEANRDVHTTRWESEIVPLLDQSLITLFEDYTKAIVPEEEDEDKERSLDKQMEEKGSAHWDSGCFTRNELRQTINQTSKTILRGKDNE